jgi:hypothetical protein
MGQYVVLGGYWDSDNKALAAGVKPFAYMIGCPYRGITSMYLKWEPEIMRSKTVPTFTWVEYPVVDLHDADTLHNFRRRYPLFDLAPYGVL